MTTNSRRRRETDIDFSLPQKKSKLKNAQLPGLKLQFKFNASFDDWI